MRNTWLAVAAFAMSSLSGVVFAGTLDDLERRARSGEIDAQVELGYRYLHGLGVEKDLYEARRWLHNPVYEANFAYAMTLLGLTYWEENLSQADHQKAFELFGEALEMGDADAHIYFGWMKATGLGVVEDRDSGIRYIEAGRDLGADGATGMLRKLADMGTTVTVPYVGYEGCTIEFTTGEVFRAWRWVAEELKPTWAQKPELDQFLCEQTENMPVSVSKYLGKSEGDSAYHFAVRFDDCNMEFQVSRSEEGYPFKTTYDHTCHRYAPPTPPPSSNNSYASGSDGTRCVSVTGKVVLGFAESVKLSSSGGGGNVDNSWSTPMICSGYNGIEGTYGYSIDTGHRVCSGTFNLTSQAQSWVTISVYDDCSIEYVGQG